MSNRSPSVAHFGDAEFDLKGLTLTRSGRRVPLGDQPARILRFLVEHGDDVVSRDALYEAFWPGNADGAEQSLNAAIRQIRKALDDDAQHPKYIETLPKRGYRLMTPPTEARAATLYASKTLSILGAAAATALLMLAIPNLVALNSADAALLISEIESNCSDANTSQFEAVLHSEIIAAASLQIEQRKRVVLGRRDPQTAPARRQIEIVANYGLANGRIYAWIVDNKSGSIIWAQKYDVNLSHTRIAAEAIGADMTAALSVIYR